MKAGEWLEHLLLQAIKRKFNLPAPELGEGLDIALVDGTVVCQPGSKGSDWRVHARYDPAQGRFTDLVLTTGRVAERAYRTLIRPGQTTIMDRGYARLVDLSSILSQQGHFIVRIGWQSLPLLSEDKQKLDILSLLPQDDQILDQVVHLKGISQPLRLVIRRLPADKAEIQRKKAVRQSNRRGRTVDPRTIEAAGYLMVLTSHPAQAVSALEICEAYRNRWQVETGIKRTKSLGGLDKLRAKTFALGRAWFLAQLLVAIMTDELANEIAGFAPRSLAPCVPDASSAPTAPQAESLMEVLQNEAPKVAMTSTQTAQVEVNQSQIMPTKDSLNDPPLSLRAQDEPASPAFEEHTAQAADQTKSEKPAVVPGYAKRAAAQKGKRQMSFWRAWAFARQMLLKAIMPDIVEFTQAQLKRVQKALSESPRKRVNRGNALRPALS